MKYFTIQECIYNSTAVAKGIDNTPSKEIEAHIVETIENLIDPLREEWEKYCEENNLGKPSIYISSGYRCPELNAVIGESSTSAHKYGYAFDLVPGNRQMRTFKKFCKDFLEDKDFDQLISEGEDENGMPSWMHIGYKHADDIQQRKQYLSMIHGKYFPMTE